MDRFMIPTTFFYSGGCFFFNVFIHICSFSPIISNLATKRCPAEQNANQQTIWTPIILLSEHIGKMRIHDLSWKDWTEPHPPSNKMRSFKASTNHTRYLSFCLCYNAPLDVRKKNATCKNKKHAIARSLYTKKTQYFKILTNKNT